MATDVLMRRTYRDASDVFDVWAFRDAVLRYMNTQQMTRRSLIAAADLDPSTGLALLRGDVCPSLRQACALANVCDLNLDSYRKAPPT